MKLYQAPLEGISGYIYRNALNEVFGGVDKYFAPFISPYEKRIITEREKNQLCPEHNNLNLVPQILTMDAEGFIDLTNWLNDNYGYEEFNLNFGCPSGTVVSKGRGAGSLGDLEKLESFLDRVTNESDYKISVKTRIGLHNADEYKEVFELYKKYHLEELIIHPRIRDELYKGVPHIEIYEEVEKESVSPVIYNGDIKSVRDYNKVAGFSYVNTSGIMIGRGMVANPGLFREIKTGEKMTKDELTRFLTLVYEGYSKDFSGEVPVLHKLKEIWVYLGEYLREEYSLDEKILKGIKKSKRISEYKIYEKEAMGVL